MLAVCLCACACLCVCARTRGTLLRKEFILNQKPRSTFSSRLRRWLASPVSPASQRLQTHAPAAHIACRASSHIARAPACVQHQRSHARVCVSCDPWRCRCWCAGAGGLCGMLDHANRVRIINYMCTYSCMNTNTLDQHIARDTRAPPSAFIDRDMSAHTNWRVCVCACARARARLARMSRVIHMPS